MGLLHQWLQDLSQVQVSVRQSRNNINISDINHLIVKHVCGKLS